MLDRLEKALSDKYEIERELGRGGMATVYLAKDRKHDREVALKVLHPELSSSLGPDRFLREIKVAARLNHPHILPLHDSGEASGFLYYVMPYVEGESLRARMNRTGKLPLDEALYLARGIAGALDYAHRQRVVHRDIKPENIMLHEGEAMVMDFGIAKAVSVAAGDTLTQAGMMVGTPAYVSPEQAAGEGTIDGRSDQYSLACMLFEVLSGNKAFTGSSAQAILTKRFTDPVPSLRKVDPTVPDEIDEAIAKAMSKEPAERYDTSGEFAKALIWPKSNTPSETTTVKQGAAPRSIAVLPFADMSAEKENGHFTDGMAEEIINALTTIKALRVASRTSSFAFKGTTEDIRQVGKKLDVATVLEGSVRKAGNKLRITAQLVNVADGYQLWSQRYDRDMEDVFAIQDEIAQNIVKALSVILSDEEKRAIEKVPTVNVEAYDCYLRGRQFFHQFRKQSLEFARQMFNKAIEIDPTYALAYAGVADCCSVLYTNFDASDANLTNADVASRRALKLAPQLAEAHVARGLAVSLLGHHAEAETEFETAMGLNPQLFDAAYMFGRALLAQGKTERAAEILERAAELRPEDYVIPGFLGSAYARLGRTADSQRAYRRAADVAMKRLELNPDDPRALYMGGTALSRLGDAKRAKDWGAQALAISPGDATVLYNVACIYATSGESDEAITMLEKAVALGFGHWAWIENDSDFDTLRDHPRYKALLEKKNE
ncbi:MAG TPA: protein kinase [Gemmatimonadaceae bacterium]|nr:protein kinase [Gemmatimonadaceae bacterium]